MRGDPRDASPGGNDVPDEILIGVGSTEAQMLAVAVLEHSIRRHTRRSVEVVPLWRSGIEIPMPRDASNAPRTPFTFQRFVLPELAGRRRRSIYFDSDMLVLTDVAALHDHPMDDADVLVPGPTPGRDLVYSVLLIAPDCPWDVREIVGLLDRGERSYEDLVFRFQVPGRVATTLSPHWNSLERYEPGETALLHYTDMWSQPWLVRKNPLAPLWVSELLAAIADGSIKTDAVAEGVARRWVRPSLLWQVEHGEPDPKRVPFWVRWRDRSFIEYCKQKKFRIF
jgi:hypothetical protein